jgi:hypothetical protein
VLLGYVAAGSLPRYDRADARWHPLQVSRAMRQLPSWKFPHGRKCLIVTAVLGSPFRSRPALRVALASGSRRPSSAGECHARWLGCKCFLPFSRPGVPRSREFEGAKGART